MKPILEWFEEAKQQGYDWADAAIRNYNPNYAIIKETKTLSAALTRAFSWRKSPEGSEFWVRIDESLRSDEEMDGFPSTITPVSPISLECLIEDLGKLNSALENLEYNETLKEPYRTQVYDATKASYEEQLAEVKAKIAEAIGLRGDSAEELSMLKRDIDRQLSYIRELEVENDGLSKELASVKGKKLIGWVVQNEDGGYSKYTALSFIKEDDGWFAIDGKKWSDITTEEAAALCDRLPKWSDNEPVAIYK